MNTPLTLGEYISRKRKERLLSLADLARAVGVSYGYMSKIENDRLTPSLRALTRIAHALSEPVSHLVDLSNYGSLPPDQGAGNPTEVLAMVKARPTDFPSNHEVSSVVEGLFHELGPSETTILLKSLRRLATVDRQLLRGFVEFSDTLGPGHLRQALHHGRHLAALSPRQRDALIRYIEDLARAGTNKESS